MLLRKPAVSMASATVWVAHATEEAWALRPFFFLEGVARAGSDWEGGRFEEEAAAGATTGPGVTGVWPTGPVPGSVVMVVGGRGGAALLSAWR